MRIVLIHPNYHSGGAEIAGNWPPAWVAYLVGYLKAGGYSDVTFIDAMTYHLDEEVVRTRLAQLKPDIVGCTAITPAIYKAERILQVAKEVNPSVVTVLGGIHATFMYPQVLKEAPWIDAIVRGEGEQVFLNFVQAVDDGRWAQDRNCVRGIAYLQGEKVIATPAEPPIKDLDRIKPDWGVLDWDQYIYLPMGTRLAIPNFARGCRLPAASAASGSSGATTGSATRRRWWTRSRTWSATTTSASSSSPMKSPPFTARSSSSSASC